MATFIEDQNEIQVQPDCVGLSWTGQAGFAFKDAHGMIYHVDPYLSNACSRFIGYHRIIPTPIKAKDVKVNFVLFTHEHKDHLDPDSIPDIAKVNPSAVFVGPSSCISVLLGMGISPERLITINRGESQKIGNMQVLAVMAFHTDDSVGYVLNFNGLQIYITGDTTYSEDLIAVSDMKLDLMMPCINGRLGCMNIPDAARLTSHIQPAYAVPMHIGMFKENTANPEEYIRQVEAYSGMVKGFIMEYGRWYLFDKNKASLALSQNY
jgi:L-ascorbate 6-phosphate lactonase